MNGKRSKPLRQLPVRTLIICDVLAIGAVLILFALFDHVIPRPVAAVQTPVPTAAPAPVLSDAGDEQILPAAAATAVPTTASEVDFAEKFPDKFTDGEIIADDCSYKSPNLNITLTEHDEYLEGCHLHYFLEDIYVRRIDCLRTAFAKNTFGDSITDKFSTMCIENNAIAAINSDYYGFGNAGICIRNGVLYRDTFEPGEEVLVLYRNGDMKVYQEGELDVQRAMEEGAWQSFSFGPNLLDSEGKMRDLSVYKRAKHEPRTILGMYEPGHYLFVVVDGRQDDWSEGLTERGAAVLSEQLGLPLAYNLDGGRTSQMAFRNRLVNKPFDGGRKTSDIVYIGEIL